MITIKNLLPHRVEIPAPALMTLDAGETSVPLKPCQVYLERVRRIRGLEVVSLEPRTARVPAPTPPPVSTPIFVDAPVHQEVVPQVVTTPPAEIQLPSKADMVYKPITEDLENEPPPMVPKGGKRKR